MAWKGISVSAHGLKGIAFLVTASILSLGQSAAAQVVDTVVRFVDKPRHEGVAPLILELRIGGPEGPADTYFGNIVEMAVGPDGSMYVFDFGFLRALDSSGRFVRKLGYRGGQEHGAFASGEGLAVTRDNRVLLWDPVNHRVNGYTPDGTVLPPIWSEFTQRGRHHLQVDMYGNVYLKRMEAMTSQGPVTFQGLGRLPDGTAAGLTYSWEMFGSDGTPLGIFRPPPFPSTQMFLHAREQRSNVFTVAPFLPLPSAVVAPNGTLVTGIPSSYAFEIRDSSRLVSVRRNVDRVALSARERDSARTAETERGQRMDPAWTWNGPDIPALRPAYEEIDVGDDGSIWVRLDPLPVRQENTVNNGAITRHDVFEANGTYIGQVEVPRGVSLFVRRADRVWGVEIDADGVRRLVRYRIGWR